MSEFGWPLQVALVAKLVAENVCDGLIYETVPKHIDYPYVRIGEISTRRADATSVDQTVEQLTLHIYAKGEFGKRDALRIAGDISTIILKNDIEIGDDVDSLFDVIAETGRHDVEAGEYIQNLRIEAQLSKLKEL
ncbi:MAG: DUF3168 domain-containing protein [Alphaproteobacteria bacterium]|nr:DUF3168 domain-containing protein [Alphaproteobacteria bacterium]